MRSRNTSRAELVLTLGTRHHYREMDSSVYRLIIGLASATFILSTALIPAHTASASAVSVAAKLSTSTTRPQTRVAEVWGACGVITSTSKVVRTYDGVAGIRRVYLKCGGPKYSSRPDWGYRHILARHRGDFENMAAGTAQNWREVADISIGGALRDPQVRGGLVDGKRCFSRRIYLYNLRTGDQVRTRIVRVVFRASDNAIVTAYPSSKQC